MMIRVSLLFIWLGTAIGQDGSTPCQPSPYRRYDGHCNNVRHPLWGSAYTPYIQLTGKRLGENLPNGVSILQELDPQLRTGHHGHVTALIGLWSKLISHDISSPVPSDNDNGGLLNAATSFLDGSSIYANADQLKTPAGFVDTAKCELCRSDVGLGSLYVLLYKEHNRVVAFLRKANSDWSGDVLFEEARKIVSAQIQHITYSEYLPIVLREIDWDPSAKRGFYNGYSSANQAGTIYETAMTSLALLSTMTPVPLALMNNVNYTDNFMESVVSSSLSTPAQLPNARLIFSVLDRLRSQNAGSYNEILESCTGEAAKTFSELTFIPEHVREILSRLYRTVDDVDLLVGAALEANPQDTLLGPTLSCLLAQQFTLTRDSDRFWYENDFPPASFTKEQLTEIRKVTLSGLMCQNTRGLLSVQPRAFVQEDPYLNALVGCDHQNALDLTQWIIPEKKRDKEPLVTMEMVKAALKKAQEDLARRQRQEFAVYRNLGSVDPKSPQGTAAAFSKPNKMALVMANNSLLFEFASQELMSIVASKQRRRRQLDGDNVIGFDLTTKDLFSDLDLIDLFPGHKHAETECPDENGPCDPRSPYRTFTGHCNNVERPNLGKSMTTFARLLPPVYEDGISSPRLTSVTGTPLPSARLVSSMIHADISYLHSRYTLMVMQFAQFVDHDLTFTPNHRGFFSSIPDCRSCNSALTVHHECMPIPVPTNDHYFPPRNVTSGERICLPFMRSLPGQQALGTREQINQNSAYLDGSHIYGEHACLARQLRGFNGRLNTTILQSGRGKELLPVSPSHPECRAPSGYCFIAGDGRASEQPGLAAIHTTFMREHNRVVDGLRSVNPHWSNEKLYQQGRRIVVAEYQHVLYNEFLPRILGWNAVNLYGLKLNSHGYYNGYSSTCNPNIVTEFATAAYRIGHSLLRPHIPRMSASFTPVEPAILLRDHFFNPDIIYTPHIIDEIMRGLTSVPMESLDQFITGEITNHLFEDKRIPHSGVDLPALNVQRARDHGIPPYNEYRALCNLKRANSWEDLSREIPAEVIARLRLIYPTVNDVDLFPGGLSERPLQGGLVGPTFACIIGLQFRQLRKCDRFWYESGDPIVRFTEPQMAEIRKSTLSKITCDNMDVPGDIQRSAFEQPSDFLNPRVPCHSLPRVDLNAWRETAQQGCQIAGRTVAVGESAIPTPCTSCICTPEGAQCASLRVTDCGRLLREMGRDAVLRDDVCSAQCSLFLTDSPSAVAAATVSLTTRRPRTRSRDFLPSGLIPPPPITKARRPTVRSFPDLGFLG